MGIIHKIKIDGNHLTMEIYEKEKVLVTYIIKTKKEKKKFLNYQLGDQITIKGTFEKAETNTNFHMFHYQKYLWSKKIYLSFKADEIIKRKPNQKIYYKIKNKMIKRINMYESKAYLHTFLLGNTFYIKEEVYKSFIKNGISHLFAISGMHITFFSVLLLKLLKVGIKKELLLYTVCFAILFFYAFLTDFSPSVLRSSFFFFLLFLKKHFHLQVSNLFLFIFLTCFFLLYNPYFVYHNGFLFSFTISFFLILCSCLLKKKNKFYQLFMVSFIAFCASFPIQVNTNFEINFLSIFLNLLFVPFIANFLFPMTLLTFLFPFLDHFLSIFIYILENMSLFFRTVSISIIFPKLNFFEVMIYYFFLFLFLFKKKKIFFLLFLFFLYSKPFFMPSFLTMIDVGQGDCFLLHDKGKNIVIDTGGKISYKKESFQKQKKEYHIAEETILYFKSMGIKKIDALLLSHGDEDHMKESLYLVSNFNIGKVFLNSGHDNLLEKKLLAILHKKKIKYQRVSKYEEKIGNIYLKFLNTKNSKNENEDSLIVYTKIKKHNILFMGDAGFESEKKLLDAYNLPKVDILKIGHHGSKNSSCEEFIKKIKPKYSLISVGRKNRYGHPHDVVMKRLKKEKSKIYLTSVHGMVRIIFRKKIVIESLRH